MGQDRDDKFEGHDDGEYHFSDDNANYEAEPDVKKAAAAPAVNAQALKKPLIGLVVFFVLIFLVYKILTPSQKTKSPVNEFANNAATATKPVPAMTKPEMNAAQAMPVAANNQPAAPVVIAPEAAPAPSAPVAMTVPPVSPANDDAARLAALEDESAKMQTDLNQKLADMTTQNAALQTKLQEMSTRLATMESALTRLSQNTPPAQEMKNNRSSIMANAGAMGDAAGNPITTTTTTTTGTAQPQNAGPKMMYSVQAIIPGRAWLKADNGETVTVAEGDTLRDFGRITKIDPYDGLVEVDTGGKIVSLSYGAGT